MYVCKRYVCFVSIQVRLGVKNQIGKDASLILIFERLNRLLLNSDKIYLIGFRPHFLSINNYFNVYVNGQIVNETHAVKYLGIIVQNNFPQKCLFGAKTPSIL